jgi:hypothetical protein
MPSFIDKIFNKEKRRYPRLAPPHIVKCDCSYTESGRVTEFLSEITNISKGGCLMMIYQEVVFPETLVEISFQLPPTKGVIKIHGIATRCYHRGGEFAHYLAVKFVDENEAGIALLLDACK